MDFHKLPKDYNRYNTILIFIDRFKKRTTSILYNKTIDAKGIARHYIDYIHYMYGPPLTIVSN
jgi:hypothetical protein